MPPFVLEGKHQVTRPALDVDWTLSDDWPPELRFRELWNQMLKDIFVTWQICYLQKLGEFACSGCALQRQDHL